MVPCLWRYFDGFMLWELGAGTVSNSVNQWIEPGPTAPLTAVPATARAILAEIKADLIIYVVVGVYALCVWALSIYLHDGERFQPFQYLQGWTLLSLDLLIVMSAPIVATWAFRAVREYPDRPLFALLAVGRRIAGLNIVSGVLLILAMAVFYGVFTSAKNMLPDIHAFTWDTRLAAIDNRILAGHDAWKVAAAVVPDGRPLKFLDMIYTKAWLFAVLGLCAYVSVLRRFNHLRRRFFLAFIFGWIVAGNILACFFMSAGPCFYADFTHDHLRFTGLLHSVSGTGSAIEQGYLWKAYVSGHTWLGSGISAFPSVHLVATVIIVLLLRSLNTRLFWLGAIFTAMIELGSVRLGWHYLTDGLVGILIAIAMWYLSGLIENFFSGEASVVRRPA